MSIAPQHETCTRVRVVEAARQLFASRGFHQTAMADLAETAGVSVGAIYRLFKGKAEIIQFIVESDAEVRIAEIKTLADQVRNYSLPIRAALTQVMLLSLSEKNEALSFEILAEAHRNAAVACTITDMCQHFRKAFRCLAETVNPQLTALQLDAAEELLLACAFGLGHRNLSGPRLGIAETTEGAAQMILAALDPQQPEPPLAAPDDPRG